MTAVACPACREGSAPVYGGTSPFELRVCRGCGIRFSNPMSHPGQRWYEDSPIYEEVRWNIPKISRLGDRWEFREAIGAIRDVKGAVLDIGCGRGDFLKLAELNGHAVSGIDLNADLIDAGKKAYGLRDIFASSLEDFFRQKEPASFDAITAFEVMEHLSNPRDFLDSCRAFLKGKGTIVLSVPGYHRWPRWVNAPVDLPPHHLTLWTEEGLRRLLASAGFSDIRVRRKPLLIGDLMYHAVRKVPGLQRPGFFPKVGRGLIKLALFVMLPFLKWKPSAGGFTLLAIGRRSR